MIVTVQKEIRRSHILEYCKGMFSGIVCFGFIFLIAICNPFPKLAYNQVKYLEILQCKDRNKTVG